MSRSERGFLGGTLTLFLLAFGLRLWWVLEVQPPGEAIYSDMRSYVFAARQAITGEPDPIEIYPSCFPYGAPYLYALQMRVFGIDAWGPMGVVQALLGALVTPLSMLTARRVLVGPAGWLAVGLLTASWHPLVTYAGFFTSEVPYACFLAATLWLWVRLVQSGRGAWLTGLVSGIAFTIRPPMVLTFVLGLGWLVARRAHLPWLDRRSAVALVAPFLVILGFSSVRHHALTGEVALISANGPIGRFFADTSIQSVRARQTLPSGEVITRRFTPPARSKKAGFSGSHDFEGWRCDATKLEPKRKEIVSAAGWTYRPWLVRRNVGFLFFRNALWPEVREAKEPPWRATLVRTSDHLARYGLLPLAAFGLLTLVRRRNLGLEIAALHVATLIVAAALYFGEIRYRVPYDPVLLLFAVTGVLVLLGRQRGPLQDRPAAVVIGLALGLLALVLAVPWPPGT